MSSQPVLLERHGAVARVTLNRPEARNSLDRPTKEALLAVLHEVAADEEVRAVVLTGAGRHFCAGQDLGEHAGALIHGAEVAFATVPEHYAPITLTLATMAKPVVAAIGGACVGAGLGFALACDLRVISDQATFSTAFTGIGLTCDSGLSATLARAVGEARARELVLLSEPFGAQDAVRWGIAGTVVGPDEVLGTAEELAARLAAGPTTAYAESKRLLAVSPHLPLAEVLVAEAEAQVRCGSTSDHVGAVEAFLGKRRPEFTGR